MEKPQVISSLPKILHSTEAAIWIISIKASEDSGSQATAPRCTCICPVELVGDPINCQASRALQTGIHYHLDRKESCVTHGTPRPALEPKLPLPKGWSHTGPYLLSCSIPLGPADGISADICPVYVVILGVPVKGHSTAHVSQWDDIVGQVLCVEADPTDVHPSGKKQELVKT